MWLAFWPLGHPLSRGSFNIRFGFCHFCPRRLGVLSRRLRSEKNITSSATFIFVPGYVEIWGNGRANRLDGTATISQGQSTDRATTTSDLSSGVQRNNNSVTAPGIYQASLYIRSGYPIIKLLMKDNYGGYPNQGVGFGHAIKSSSWPWAPPNSSTPLARKELRVQMATFN